MVWPESGAHRNNQWDILVRNKLVELEALIADAPDATDITALQDALTAHEADTSTHGVGEVADVADLAPFHPEILYPVGFQAANLTTETANVSGVTVVQYLGKAPRALSTLTLRCRVSTAAATITWAEVAVLIGSLGAPGVGPTLNLAGFTNVAATFNTTGVKDTAITLTGVDPGDEIWLAWGSSATTPYQLRAGIGDDLSTGITAFSVVRPSLVSATGFGASNLVPAWLAAYI